MDQSTRDIDQIRSDAPDTSVNTDIDSSTTPIDSDLDVHNGTV